MEVIKDIISDLNSGGVEAWLNAFGLLVFVCLALSWLILPWIISGQLKAIQREQQRTNQHLLSISRDLAEREEGIK
jgi:uncharacterized membrane protein YdbT with pleckstrin-like domain